VHAGDQPEAQRLFSAHARPAQQPGRIDLADDVGELGARRQPLGVPLVTMPPGDRRLFGRLRRLGITPAETKRTVTLQIAVIFLLPFAIGGLHAAVALGALGTLLMANVVQYTLIVIGLFALVQTGFYLLTRWTYLRALRPAR